MRLPLVMLLMGVVAPGTAVGPSFIAALTAALPVLTTDLAFELGPSA